ncbi:MAG TPA: serine hydrolase, partial [Candidatus Aminicenantes bacterium]|nr:serine hydrolase [Candidatus Aminicenantes bacterium]
PIQGAKDLPLAGIKAEGGEVVFMIGGVPGEPTFKGRMSADGATISGTFIQGGGTFPFELARGENPAAKARRALEGFGEIVAKGLTLLEVPGAAVAVVKDEEVILAEGFGFRDIEKKLPMTADTLLAIGSSTKAFTAFALGTLVDRGQVDWDTPVREYIPWFRLEDTWAGQRLTPRDLVTHRSGLPRHDLVWYNNLTATREDLVRSLAHLEPSADLRAKWQYNNLMFLTAGYLIETMTARSWEEAVRALVFEPLGMTRSNFSVADSRKDEDFALPYGEREDRVVEIPFRDITTIGPAGSINSCVNEMARWVMVHINGGKFGDTEVIGAATLADLHTPYMTTGDVSDRPDITAADYALGWFVDSYRGHRRVHHGGNIDGFSAMVAFFPNDGLGFVVLTNKNGSGLPELLVRTGADRILDLEAVDWIGDAAKRRAEGEEVAKKAEEKKATRRRPGTAPAHKLDKYAGGYHHPGYGSLKVTLESGRLGFVYNGIATPLEHWHFETFSGGKAVTDPVFEDMKLTFRTDANGYVVGVGVPFEGTVDDIYFAKEPDERLSDPAYLGTLLGTYSLASQTVTVALKGDVLTITIPGQPTYELVPEIGGEFSLKEARVVRLRFVEGPKGEVTALEISQPGGVFEYKRVK